MGLVGIGLFASSCWPLYGQLDNTPERMDRRHLGLGVSAKAAVSRAVRRPGDMFSQIGSNVNSS